MLKKVQSIPGGLMLVPMLLASLIHTLAPQLLEIGNPTTALFTGRGTMAIVGVMLVFAGIQVRVGDLLPAARRGGILIGVKLLIDIAAGLLIMGVFGMDGVLGIPAVAWIACLTSCNPGMYIALMNSCGDRVDKANFAILSVVGLPFVPVCVLGFAQNFSIDYVSILATCIPFFVGMLLSIIDGNIREFAKSGTAVMLPFLGFCLGSSIDLTAALGSWWLGLLLYAVYMVVQLPVLFLIDRKLLKQRGHAAVAICCVAGLALTVPSIMAGADPDYERFREAAMAQLSFTVVISAFVTPLLMKALVAKGDSHTKLNHVDRREAS
ncbi:MAG: kdgT1 [Paenibacillaceae bacterium]|jgi:2-keto-3-deoxygluconate permease|nr:kdgT1 [Paenibacillaceae bacterium]